MRESRRSKEVDRHAWCNPREVKRYVKENRDRLSGLSQREALKNIEKNIQK
jgi:ABC-type Zn uptake system ZnuABC Zn-binding protein ZnuA